MAQNFTDEQKTLLRDAFNGIDEDDSGYIEKRELINLYKEVADELGEPFDMDKAEADFKKSDTNGDGKIDFNEFVANLSHFVI